MILMEFFTESHIDNIAACLRLQPRKLIMVGLQEEMSEAVARYRLVFQKRGIQTQIAQEDVSGKDIRDICMMFRELLQENEVYVIDLTGGDEQVILALGAALAGLPEEKRKNILVEKIDHDTNFVLDCGNDNRFLAEESVNLTVEEIIALHGGSLQLQAEQPPLDYPCQELDTLWELVSDDPKEWNRKIKVLNEFESRADSQTQVYLPLWFLQNSIQSLPGKEADMRQLLQELHNSGVVDDQSSYNALEYTYRSPAMRRCTQKAGNVLELKTLLEGRRVMLDGEPFFQDCLMSVGIDWDGEIHAPEDRVAETRNEVDVVLMHGMTALFVSCKNGDVGDSELYKLHTVATRFGGPYARKMLVVTNLGRKSDMSYKAIERRAKDMGITLVAKAAGMTQEQWQEKFIQAVLKEEEDESEDM